MKYLILFLALCTVIHAATPKMWVKDRGGHVPLRIDAIDTEINILGDIVETTLTLRFRNETNRQQEGEFVMPLPQGSTVSSYALEVNGKLRESVAVEKNQARNAYESIKRQMIDPGLIEREENNTYRTKVFPIPAKGTKLVRISYIERLKLEDGKLRYLLPIDYPGEVDQFTCTIRHQIEHKPEIQSKSLRFTSGFMGQLKASVKKQHLEGDLEISLTPLPQQEVIVENDQDSDSLYYYLNFTPPSDVCLEPRRHTQTMNIIWDASDSRRSQNHRKELDLLDAYFKYLANQFPEEATVVTLQILRNTLHESGEFVVKSGEWASLRKAIEDVFYDGSTGLAKIASSQRKVGVTLFFTDAHERSDSNLPVLATQQTTFIIHQGQESLFQSHIYRGFGESIPFSKTSIPDALQLLTHTSYQLSLSAGADDLVWLRSHDAKNQSLVGMSRKAELSEIQVVYRNANGSTIRQRLSTDQIQASNHGEMIQKFWAQEKLLKLEREGNHESKVLAHCKRYGLVSDYSSLIVLDRFEDYVKYDIPPPEPDLREKWQQRRKITLSSRKNRRTDYLKNQWLTKLHWYQRTFTWRSKSLTANMTQAKIWVGAIQSVFKKEDLDLRTFGIIESWFYKTEQFARDEKSVVDKKSLSKWLGRQSKLMVEWETFAELPVKQSAGQKLAVSVRGLVKDPKTYRLAKPLSLKQSIELAGGSNEYGNLQYVSLYRNTNAITYNLLSKHYKDIPLLPGDMVVVEPEFHDYSECCFGDPFGSSAPKDPSEKPAIASDAPRVNPDPRGSYGSEEGTSLGGRPPRKNLNTRARIRILPPEGENIDQTQFKEFAKQLKNKADPEALYQKLKREQVRPLEFYVEAARILQQHHHSKLALQVLSNIHEADPHSIASQRAFAYWLGELGRWDVAIKIFQSQLLTYPEDFQVPLDLIRYQQRKDQRQNRAMSYRKLMAQNKIARSYKHARSLVIALTERNAYLQKSEKASRLLHSQNLASDIRCVIYSSDSKAKVIPQMKELSRGGIKYRGGNPLSLDPVSVLDGEIVGLWGVTLQGGRFTSAPGIQEYMLRHAMPGTYTLSCRSKKDVTVQVAFYTHWGTKKQTCQWTTVHLKANAKIQPIAECILRL